MEITYIGHSCFKIKGKEVTVVVDLYNPAKVGYKLPKLEADIVLITHDHEDHNYLEGVKNYRMVINTAGEYESKGVYIQGIEVFHDGKQGEERGENIMYLIDIDDVDVLHAGDLGHEFSEETLDKIANVDVLLLPVGGTYTINAEKAVDVISELEPGIVVPMHYQTSDLTGMKLDPLDKFLDEMGVSGKNGKEEKIKISNKSDIPEETTVIVLEPQH